MGPACNQRLAWLVRVQVLLQARSLSVCRHMTGLFKKVGKKYLLSGFVINPCHSSEWDFDTRSQFRITVA